jgi:hypothetical protein
VDDSSYEDKSFNFDQYSTWLHSKDFNPDFIARESQITTACDTLLDNIEYGKLSPDMANKLRSDNQYISPLFIAAWCLLRLGYIEDKSFDPALRANRLVNILPESFKPGEEESLAIIRATAFSVAADKIDYIFISDSGKVG